MVQNAVYMGQGVVIPGAGMNYAVHTGACVHMYWSLCGALAFGNV